MSKSVRVRLHLPGLNALMRSAPVQDLVDKSAESIRSQAGEEFETVSVQHKWTARAYVQNATWKGWRQESKEGRLTRAVGSHVR